MADLSSRNPLERFTGLADNYARHRPDYPATAIDYVMEHCRLRPDSILVDIGSGTGISSRQFAARGLHVVGIEPNADMRRQAEAQSAGNGSIDYRAGRAEATGLADGSADAVLTAQAFHWFDAPAALREFHRVLRPEGWVIVLGNERDESDPATTAYGEIVGGGRDAAAIERPRRVAAQVLHQALLFTQAEQHLFEHVQWLDEDGLVGRAFSASYAPREPEAAKHYEAALRQVFARFQQDGRFRLKYITSVDSARKLQSP
jgi:ubiquinone/menaquinone biosynthesis C-methylase UbiE